MAKILAKECRGKLYEVTEKIRRPVFEKEKVLSLYKNIMMSAKAPKADGRILNRREIRTDAVIISI